MTAEREDLPSAVAADIKGDFRPPLTADEANLRFTGFLADVTRDCAKAGAVMIGHVKANARSGKEMLSMNSTTEDGNVRTRSKFTSDVKEYTMTINVIIYGITEEIISQILDRRCTILGRNSIKVYSDTGCKDPKCNDPACKLDAHRIIKLE